MAKQEFMSQVLAISEHEVCQVNIFTTITFLDNANCIWWKTYIFRLFPRVFFFLPIQSYYANYCLIAEIKIPNMDMVKLEQSKLTPF